VQKSRGKRLGLSVRVSRWIRAGEGGGSCVPTNRREQPFLSKGRWRLQQAHRVTHAGKQTKSTLRTDENAPGNKFGVALLLTQGMYAECTITRAARGYEWGPSGPLTFTCLQAPGTR